MAGRASKEPPPQRVAEKEASEKRATNKTEVAKTANVEAPKSESRPVETSRRSIKESVDEALRKLAEKVADGKAEKDDVGNFEKLYKVRKEMGGDEDQPNLIRVIWEESTNGEFQRRVKYTALRSQSRFHRTKKRFKGFSGPVGSGKSAALCFEALRAAYRNQGRTGLIGAPTYNMLRDATLPSFLEMVEENGFPYQLNRSTFTVTFPEVGSNVLFRSLDEYERLRGSNLAWFGIDELTYCAEEAWTRLEARLRDPKATVLSGFAVWTPKGFDWVYRRFLAEPVAGYGLVEAKPFENRYLLEKTPDFYERLKASYDERFYEQEVLGSYRNLQAGQVYYAFDSTGGVGDFEVEPSAEILWSWDFNVNPMASVIAQRRGDRVCVIDEIYLTTSSTEEVCEEFLGRYGDHRGGVRVYGDATGERRYSVSSFSDYALIRRFLKAHPELKGVVDVGKANPPVRDRVNLVNSKLAGADGERRLLVGRRCRKVIQDLEQVCYKPDSGVIDKDRDSARTHLSDALGYLVWMEFKSVGKVGERSGRLV